MRTHLLDQVYKRLIIKVVNVFPRNTLLRVFLLLRLDDVEYNGLRLTHSDALE